MNRFIHLIITVIMIAVISRIAISDFNASIFGLFAGIIGYLLFLTIKRWYEYNSGKCTICFGTIISFENDTEENDYKIQVAFPSPDDNKEYQIVSKIMRLPENKKVEVIFNHKNPEKSEVYIKPKTYQVSLLGLGFLFCIYQCISNLIY